MSRNNLLRPDHQSPPISSATEYARDSEFYCNFNIVTLLVGGILFRFQASIIAPDPEVKNYEMKAYMGDMFNLSSSHLFSLGTSNDQPIILPTDVTIDAFRDLLMFSSGGVTNTKLKEILHTVNRGHREGYKPALINRLSKLGHLAGRFGMKTLDNWTQSKIRMMFDKSMLSLSHNPEWDTEIILQLVQHMRGTSSPAYQGGIICRIVWIMCNMVCSAYDNPDKSKDLSEYAIIRMCTDLYKEKNNLLTSSPDVFGFIFAVVLSLGPRSSIWNDDLSREDRRVLYAANSILTCIREHTDLKVAWLLEPSSMLTVIKDCSDCSKRSNFYTWWEIGFGQCQGLSSSIPLKDIRHIARLLNYKDLLYEASVNRRECPKRCPDRLVSYAFERIQSTYCALAEKYQHFEETV